MNDIQLIKIYEESYKLQHEDLMKSLDKIHEDAIDKNYALKFQLATINLVGGLLVGTELDKLVNNLFEHNIKLGGKIIDVIHSIPNVAEEYKQKKKNSKSKINTTITWKKKFGIPYKINKVETVISKQLSSTFENETNKVLIAKSLGKKRAIIDIKKNIEFQLSKYEDTLEFKDINQNELIPYEYNSLKKLKDSLIKNDLDNFFSIFQGIFASLSYDIKITEGYFHSHIHLILSLLGFNINSEVETNKGRIDAVIETERYVHIIEFKQNDSQIALEQILKKEYYQKYYSKNKKIILVGVAFDVIQRNITNWKVKIVDLNTNI